MTDDGTTEPARHARKAEHVALALGLPQDPGSSWDDVVILHDALPDTDLDAVDLSAHFLGHELRLPVMISGMTGGYDGAHKINRRLARAATRHGIAMGVGSQRAALGDSRLVRTYTVIRDEAPHAFIVANIGINQLIDQDDHPAIGVHEALRAVEMIRADALAVHLNYLEEVVQPEGQTRARGAARALAELAAHCPVPVIAKETGCGVSRRVAERLRAVGVAAIDVGGSGGTSFAAIEATRAQRQDNILRASLGDAFADWGIPTPASVLMCAPLLPTIASGGLRSGLDIAKSLAIGATLAGIARPFLSAALAGSAALDTYIERLVAELRTATFLSGIASASELTRADVVVRGSTAELTRDEEAH